MKEEREVTDILQNEENVQQDRVDMTTRSYEDKGKGHVMPFEYPSITCISPILSSTSTRSSILLPPEDAEPDPDPSSSGSENHDGWSRGISCSQSSQGDHLNETSSLPHPPPPSPPPPSSPPNSDSNNKEDNDNQGK